MAIAHTLLQYLAQQGVAYDIVRHTPTSSSLDTAQTARISANKLAKPVILEDDTGYVMAVVPASLHVGIGRLNRVLNRRMGLATESEIRALFTDCDFGAIPPVGQAYGIETIVDDSLDDCDEVYFEAGDHAELIHVRGNAFRKLMKSSKHGSFCAH